MPVLPPWTKRFVNNLLDRTLTTKPVRTLTQRRVIDTASLRSVAEREGGLHVYGSEETVSFGGPECLCETPDEVAVHVGRYRFEEPFLATLDSCQLVGPAGLAITTDGQYVLENSLRSERHLLRSIVSTLESGDVPVRRCGDHPSVGTALSLVGPWCRGYFHWFSEWLPRLEGRQRYADQTGVSATVVVPPDPPEWMQESLSLVGVNDYVEWDGTRWEVDRLLVPSLRRGHPVDAEDQYSNAPEGYRWVREQMLKGIGDRRRSEPARILISRRRADERRVVNRAEVEALLEGYGFETYELETMSFREQVALFERAEAVVSPHGAGLVNCIYGQDTAIVELFGQYVNACYYTMAAGLGLDYGCLECEPVGPDLRVNVDRLETLVTRMLD